MLCLQTSAPPHPQEQSHCSLKCYRISLHSGNKDKKMDGRILCKIKKITAASQTAKKKEM